MLNNSRKLLSKWQHFYYCILDKIGGVEKRSNRAFPPLILNYTITLKYVRISKQQTWSLQAQYKLHMKLHLWLITQSRILSWAMLWRRLLLRSDSAHRQELCSNDIQEQGPSFLPSLPYHPNYVSTRQDKLRDILQNNTSEAAKLCILEEQQKKKRNNMPGNLTKANTERCSQTAHVFPSPPLTSAAAETSLNISNLV